MPDVTIILRQDEESSMSFMDEASNEVESDWVPAAASVNVDNEESAPQVSLLSNVFLSLMVDHVKLSQKVCPWPRLLKQLWSLASISNLV